MSEGLYKQKIQIVDLCNFLVLFFIFLGSMDVINRYYYWVYIAFIIFIVTPQRSINITFSFVFLVILSMAILIFDSSSHESITFMIKPFTYPVCYIMGCSFFNKSHDIDVLQKKNQKIIIMLAFGAFVHLMLNAYLNLNSSRIELIEFWSRKPMSATGQATFACISVGVTCAIIFSDSKIVSKIVSAAVLSFIILYNFILAGRTLFFFIIVTIGVSIFYRNSDKKNSILKTAFVFSFIILIIAAIFNFNVFGIRDMYENSNFYYRFFSEAAVEKIDADSRILLKEKYLEKMLDHPFGGGYIYKAVGGYAHDLYFDTYDNAGVFALIGIVGYIVLSIIRMFKCVKNKKLKFETRQMILCVYCVVNMQFWLEPIIKGMPWLLASYCFMDGMLSSLLNKVSDIEGEMKFENS